jgi:predicted metal-binding membrane protein
MIRSGEISGFDGRIEMRQHRVFLGTGALLFVASVATTIDFCESMSGGMAMPGGWTMSMAWMGMPGQSWLASATSFMGMWIVMMAAMMLPALVPTLLRYRLSLRGPRTVSLNAPTALAGAGYFSVWAILGTVVYPIGLIVTNAEMRWLVLARLVPLMTGVVLLFAGSLQLTAWKARRLCRCRDQANCVPTSHAREAWRHGFRLGMHCLLCCFGLMMVVLATGVMNLGAMALITVAITVERLAPRPMLVARAVGAVMITVGVFLIVLGASSAWGFGDK